METVSDITEGWGVLGCDCLLLGAYATLRLANISFVISVRPSIRLSVCLSVWMEQLGFH